MILRLLTPATANCVLTTEVHTWVRGSSRESENDLFPAMIRTAERYAENYMKRAIMAQTWRLTLDCVPLDGIIELPRPPLQTPATANVTFQYTDDTGGTQTMPSTCYDIDAESEPARIYLAYNADWPTNIRDHKNSITIDYNVGVTSVTAVAEPIKSWVKFRVGAMYENRESLTELSNRNSLEELPRSYVDGLLDEFCVIKVF